MMAFTRSTFVHIATRNTGSQLDDASSDVERTGMINKLHANVSFKWFDFWIGIFWDRPGMAFYICLLPMIPIKIWMTEHKRCPVCERLMQKSAYNTGDGWGLFWQCSQHGYADGQQIDWPFEDSWITGKELLHLGYDLID